jgi:excisionase family DNA binding protein
LGNLKTESPIAQGLEASDWLTPKDVQLELRIGAKLCYRLLRSGAVPSIRIGNLYRIPRAQLEEALLAQPDLGNKA